MVISVIYKDVKILYNQRKCVENHSYHMRAQQFAHETTFSSKARAQCLPPCSVRLNRQQEALYPSPTFFFYHNYTFSVKLTHMFKKKQRNYCNFATYPSCFTSPLLLVHFVRGKNETSAFSVSFWSIQVPNNDSRKRNGKKMCRL